MSEEEVEEEEEVFMCLVGLDSCVAGGMENVGQWAHHFTNQISIGRFVMKIRKRHSLLSEDEPYWPWLWALSRRAPLRMKCNSSADSLTFLWTFVLDPQN